MLFGVDRYVGNNDRRCDRGDPKLTLLLLRGLDFVWELLPTDEVDDEEDDDADGDGLSGVGFFKIPFKGLVASCLLEQVESSSEALLMVVVHMMRVWMLSLEIMKVFDR